jgi:3-phosphoshikimate 1-carboxyvinyltransferase
MRYWGLSIEKVCKEQRSVINVFKPVKYTNINILLERDLGLLANFLVLVVLSEGSSMQSDIDNIYSLIQTDKVIIDILLKAKCNILTLNNVLYAKYTKDTKPLFVDLKNCIDLAPILFVYASLHFEKSVFTGYETLRYKESDRLKSMEVELKKIGVSFYEEDSQIFISSGSNAKLYHDAVFFDHGDHRVYFALRILTKIIGFGKVVKSSSKNKTWAEFDKILDRGYSE